MASAPTGLAPTVELVKGVVISPVSTPAVVAGLQKAPFVTHVSSMKVGDEVTTDKKLQSQISLQNIKRRVTGALKVAGLDLVDKESANVKSLWGVFDVDGDGVIDFKEFCQYTMELRDRRRRRSGIETLSLLEAKFVRLVNREVRR